MTDYFSANYSMFTCSLPPCWFVCVKHEILNKGSCLVLVNLITVPLCVRIHICFHFIYLFRDNANFIYCLFCSCGSLLKVYTNNRIKLFLIMCFGGSSARA